MSEITLRSYGNLQDSFYHYNLVTGRRLHRRRFTPLPIPQDAIDRVHLIAEKQGTPEGIEFVRIDGSYFENLIHAPQQYSEVTDEAPDGDNEEIAEQDDVSEAPENTNYMLEVINVPSEAAPDIISIADADDVDQINIEGSDDTRANH